MAGMQCYIVCTQWGSQSDSSRHGIRLSCNKLYKRSPDVSLLSPIWRSDPGRILHKKMSRFARTPQRATPRAGRPRRSGHEDLVGTGLGAVAEAVGRALLTHVGSTTPRRGGNKPIVPEKCLYTMSTGAFRGWKRSMEDWIKLSKLPREDAVLNIRLNCEEKLRRAIDAQFPSGRWSSFSVEDAFDAVSKITTKTMNKAVVWDKFFSMKQTSTESAKEYIHRCQQVAIDCEFQCPDCRSDLSDHILLHKLVNGLNNVKLKQDILQSFEKFDTIAKFMVKCESFEETERECRPASLRREETIFTEAGTSSPSATDQQAPCEDVAGVKTAYKKQKDDVSKQTVRPKQKCDFCNTIHVRGRQYCPAGNATCFRCNKVGHFSVCCRSKGDDSGYKGYRTSGSGAGGTDTSVGHVNVYRVGNTHRPKRYVDMNPKSNVIYDVGAASYTQPLLLVKIEYLIDGRNKCAMLNAVADTGAEVCIAGLTQAKSLGIDVNHMQKSQVVLQHAAGGSMNILGKCDVTIFHGGKCVTEDIYFVSGTNKLFLSLHACKSLGLVDPEFPHHVVDEARNCGAVQYSCNEGRPTELPYSPTESNVILLKQWLLERFSGSTFNVNRRPFPMMSGKPHHIHLLPDAIPYACHTPITVPKHWENEVKRQIDEDVRAGILRPVPTGDVTEWCARMVVVGKKDGTPRRTVDFQKLNSFCKRETHHTFAPFDMVSGVPVHTFKTTVDAYWGFHQVDLDEASRRLTTFITPWGRYQYCRTPMGHCSASDAYTKRFDDIIIDVPRKLKCVDDILLYDSSVEESFWHAYDLLEKCERNGITLHPNKFQFCQREVDFVGYNLAWERYLPSEDKLAAVKKFPMPEQPTITDIRSWFGLVNQLAPFVATAPIMAPFRDLLKKGVNKKVYWDDNLKLKFEQAKVALCKLMSDGLAYYDKSRPTVVLTDWSKEGIGFVILQQYCNCVCQTTPFCCSGGWKLALCGSRHLTNEETNYAAIEGEAAAVVWCLKKARLFLLGCPNLTLATDHRPLVKLFGDRELKHIDNPRLFRLKEKTLHFRFNVKYIEGKKNTAADTLSRYPSLVATADDDDAMEAEEMHVAASASVIASTHVIEDDVIVLDSRAMEKAAVTDTDYQLLLNRVRGNDWPGSRSDVEPSLKPYFQVRDRLGHINNLITYAFDEGHVRLVVPGNLRERVARCLHSGHQGVDSMLRRARQSVYWPGMEGDLKFQRSKCTTCNMHAPSQQREPLMPSEPPDYPFQKTAADFFQIDSRFYLAYADRLTGWLELSYFNAGVTSAKIIPVLRRLFCRWGTPEEISTDGGTNLCSSEMLDFYRRWGVKLRVSSAQYPQSNGRAEAAVRSAKRMVRDNLRGDGSLDTDEAAKAMMQYRNTPLRDIEKSPAQLALGRQLRDSIPMSREYYLPDSHWAKTIQERERAMTRSMMREKDVYDIHAKQLPYLRTGNHVLIQDPVTKMWDRSGIVMERYPYRQYLVKINGSGRMTRRNRRHLKFAPTTPTVESADNSSGRNTTPLPSADPTHTPPLLRRESSRTCKRPAWMADYIT